MNRLFIIKSISALVVALAVMSCDDEGLDVLDIEVPEGYALSAGTSTIFMNSSKAYDSEAEWVTGALASRFTRGDRLYDDMRTSSNDYGGGLGPVYAGYSCGSCHGNAGRTKPALWSDGGSGPYGFSAMLVYVTRKNGAFFKDYGRVIHDQAIYGVSAEGKLKVEWRYESGSFPDGETYELACPSYTITDWYADEIDPDDLFCTVRIPLRHVGMGQIMSLDPVEIEALASRSNYPEYGISGRCNYVTERGVLSLGVSGNKAQHADLTVELGFSSDMGVTNSRYPEEICEGQIQINQGSMMGLLYDKLDVSTEDMENVDLYMQSLGVPARRNVNDPEVKMGERMFYEAKCHLCHVTTLHTRPRGSVLLNGTQLPWLGNQTIHPYSDFLLHDMGSEIMGVGLNDNYVSGLARGNEWRTTPLWGIGLQEKVNGHTCFLHDGRARNFVEAIMWHGGEGEASRNLFKAMTKERRDALVKFLESL
ncbi:di-heme oxidoredictase family protein [Muribaculum sp. NM65_B17]|uniref:di-heme oxidoredictase family protein n=1 Tax=uncultured Muribaculum sp. TaxID=1918613 RepID=UPI0010935187|nr:di-heme oxidoredictase family protein [Muribaculum sp. NM65_B17]TGY05035.1 thiol oxidoreductase [Muribaculum sp. NM65_B17]THG44727.1 thiol oxidoreductase [Muribaculaceae bacterium]